MPIYAKKSESLPREKPPLGNIQAVCQSVHDVGMQMSKTKKVSHVVVIVWEINHKMTTGEFAGKRMVQSQRYTLSMYDNANLRKDLESWRGKKFVDEDDACSLDLQKLIGANCLLNLVENGNYINIKGVTPLLPGMQKMIPELSPAHEFKWIAELKKKQIITDELPPEITTATSGDIQTLTPGEDPHAPKKDDLPF